MSLLGKTSCGMPLGHLFHTCTRLESSTGTAETVLPRTHTGRLKTWSGQMKPMRPNIEILHPDTVSYYQNKEQTKLAVQQLLAEQLKSYIGSLQPGIGLFH
jgi:hypothetical protein